ncbi:MULTISPECIES: M23 family metallopeptidase [unclassified Beijerinckia]|uniref:M23 family metallopeptidase n=1 Tax=unclassified Beijerinckia TaxID=2638183 RepID=UPI00089A9268|nr:MULTISPECIES: M23 family metallopeptidase [unclassified Beijerinckia]MDH7799705.1 murein DD-endopeptidase MepM/ murein hydrolase activator NlpD [Beijerinckia sp. GAS462]SEB49777.1 Murein DD-endopeptidase MepM and murein hydrolase activator NlpD, contain LysM domain [Beijerinckia sp. 28-YEA-48]
MPGSPTSAADARWSAQGNTPGSAQDRRLDDRRSENAVDLGVDPPIEADGRRHSHEDHRRVSLRWLSGTALTGIAGGLLIGSAVFAALDQTTNFAEEPQLALAAPRPQERDIDTPHRGDRLVRPVDLIAARQTFRTPTTIRVGDREIVRTRNFTRVATTMTLASTGFADDVPPFNPLRLLAGSPSQNENLQVELDHSREDADVSFTSEDVGPITEDSFGLSRPEVEAQVAETVKSALRTGSQAPLALPSQMLLMRTSRANFNPGPLSYANPNESPITAPFSSIAVKMVAENVSVIPKNEPAHDSDEQLIVVRRGDTLDDVLKDTATKDQIRKIAAALGSRRGGGPVNEGQKVRVLLCDTDGNGQANRVCRISVYTDENLESTAALADNGEYVQVAQAFLTPSKPIRKASDDDEDEEDSGGMRLYNSFFETALKQEIPRSVIDDLVRIFANDIDFQRSTSAGDSFEVFYEENEESEGRYDLLYASITARNETYKYYRYVSPDDNSIDFFDGSGRSTRRFLIRKPIAIGEQRSGFGMRRHPIMGYSRMHTGVDWAAPVGTPIVAAGNGTVIKAARESGYGNRVEIQHANGYITTYNHMTGFARGITEGVRVRQGQVVGFLGSTGLSTGPHLHYEVIVNGSFVDPLRIRLARTRELTGRQIADFRRERERIDDLMSKAPNATRVAQRTN